MGRLLMNEARFDAPNDAGSNGERLVQAAVLRYWQREGAMVVFDIGANVGDWSSLMMQQAGNSPGLEIHAFEPCNGTYNILVNRIRTLHVAGQVIAIPKACSSSSGTATLHVVAVGAGTNSLTCADPSSSPEVVQLTSIDDYCLETRLNRLALVKIDAEGHDFEVIRGAARMLQQQTIDVLQFEYNQRWVFGHFFLRDAFDFLYPLRYIIGKVTPYGVEFYRTWEWELETFREGNYVACRREWVDRFKQVYPTWSPALCRT
jgi:FkbM family methyltransferase